MELIGKKVLVVGLGKTGIQTARFLIRKGAEIRASDITPFEKLPEDARKLEKIGVKIEAGQHKNETFLWADKIVLSPGVPFGLPPVKEAMARGIEVMSELELAWSFIKRPVVGVSGSNGKTTTSTLIARVLEASGKKIFLGANIGTPLVQIAEDDDGFDFLILELSSFQLQGISSFRPYIGVLLNVSPNHLDHHEGFDEYVESKMKLFSSQTALEWAIYNGDDSVIGENAFRIKSRKIPFGKTPIEGGVFFDGTYVRFRDEVYDLRRMKLIGIHNVENAMAAIATARILECEPELIESEIVKFDPLSHRIEFVCEVSEARFYNDSKSTSPGATIRALESFPPPIILIAGGKDKGVSYGVLKDAVREKVKLLVLFGESRFRMQNELGGELETVLASTLEEAVGKALAKIAKGDTVLFSPACSSFDMFSSYEDRGRRFKEIVQNISV
ncbi:MAG: UDP-N-acetylmuramoyl-L-alanine--D-glutamate ligase [Thermodesulfobacteriota bacterium]|jgi:UDP-N-acetylmuramoylalanine--D-glutamate ligase